MRMFRIMVEGRDSSGAFLVTCTVIAESLESARAKLAKHSLQTRWEITNWENQEDLGLSSGEPSVVSETGRTYFDVSGGAG